MNYQQLREKIQNQPKSAGCATIERSPLLNSGFSGTFNLSFTEDPWLREYGGYLDFGHDYIFSTIQSCIRHNDIGLIGTEQSWKYLGVFEISDLGGMINLRHRPDYAQLQRQRIRELLKFLHSVGISSEHIYPSYHGGGPLGEVTNGKYSFRYQVPEDKISKEGFVESGVPEKNLIVDRSRDTLLSLHVHRPTPWGYRNEINVNIGTKDVPRLLDIGTLEYMLWKPIFSGEEIPSNIIDLDELSQGISVTGIGLERLCMVINGLERVQDVDYIKPVYTSVQLPPLAIESIRALHRIYADITRWELTPGRQRKKKMRDLLRNIPAEYPLDQIRDGLSVHADNQPWHPELYAGIEPTLERIALYRESTR